MAPACRVPSQRSEEPRPVARLEVTDATHDGTAVKAAASPLVAAAMQQQGRQQSEKQREAGLAWRSGECPENRT